MIFGIYVRDREVARLLHDPLLALVEASSRIVAEQKAASFVIPPFAGAGLWAWPFVGDIPSEIEVRL